MANEKPNVVVLQSCGRAGSLFFGSLLDGHPNIALLPRTNVLASIWESLPRDLDELTQALVDRFRIWFDGSANAPIDRFDRLGPNQDQTYDISSERFVAAFKRRMSSQELTFTSFFVQLHFAYREVVRDTYFPEWPKTDPQTIFFNVHGIDTTDFEALDPSQVNRKMLFLTREPIKNLDSNVRFIDRILKDQKNFRRRWKLAIRAAMTPLFREIVVEDLTCYGKADPNEFFPVLLDILHLKPEMVMQAFCDFARIPFHDSLLHSTIMGLAWWGNGAKQAMGFNHEWPLTEVNANNLDDARVLVPLIKHRMVTRGLPRGASELSSGILNIFRIAGYEKRFLRVTFSDLRQKYLPDKAFLSIRNRYLTFGFWAAMFSAIVVPNYLSRVLWSLRFRWRNPGQSQVNKSNSDTGRYRAITECIDPQISIHNEAA